MKRTERQPGWPAGGRRALPWLIGAAVLVAVALPAAPGSAEVTVRQVQQGIQDYMNHKFKCAGLRVQVTPHADPALLAQGRLRSIAITVTRAERQGIVMNDLSLKATDVTISLTALFQLGKLRTASRASADIRATIKEGELNKAFARAKLPIQQFAVKFEGGKIVATGIYQFVAGNKLKLVGGFVPRPDGIHFMAQQASVNGVPLPIGQVRTLLAKMNPIIDFADIPFSPNVTRIVIQKDTLTISG